MLFIPELYILSFSIVFLFLSLGKTKGLAHPLAKLLATAGLLITAYSAFGVKTDGLLFYGAYSINYFSQIFKLLIAYGFWFVIFMYNEKDDTEDAYKPEYYMFLSFSILGLMMLVSSVELISIVISLEISSYSLYAIVPLRKSHGKKHLEATAKYLFFGAISTGIMLYGMGYLYGMARSTFLADIIVAFPQFIHQPIGIFAILLTLTGFFFKLSLFPMHFWAPDIYEGASNTTTTFIATVPKIAAAALLIRITMLAFPSSPEMIKILMVLAALSMTFGNLVGLVQKDIKRLLAYSGIAHAGYLIIGLLALNREGSMAVLYYTAIYLFMNLGLFYVIILLSKDGRNVTIDDLPGLARRAPMLAFVLAVSAFSLAGIPPTGGFTGKLFLFTSAFRQGYLPIVLIGAANTVISIFYYLNLVRMSYSKDAVVTEPLLLGLQEKVLCSMIIVLILGMGILPFLFFKVLCL